MVTNSPEELEKLSQEYEHHDKPIIDLGLKPSWVEEKKEPPVTAVNSRKNEMIVLPFLP